MNVLSVRYQHQQHHLLSGNSLEAVAGNKSPKLWATDSQADGILISAALEQSGWVERLGDTWCWELQPGWAVLSEHSQRQPL